MSVDTSSEPKTTSATRRVKIPEFPISETVILPEFPRSPPRPVKLNIFPPTQSSLRPSPPVIAADVAVTDKALLHRLQSVGYEGRPAVASSGMVLAKPTHGVPNQDFSWWRNAVPFGLSLPMAHPPPPHATQVAKPADFSGVPINLTVPVPPPPAPPVPTGAMPLPRNRLPVKPWRIATTENAEGNSATGESAVEGGKSDALPIKPESSPAPVRPPPVAPSDVQRAAQSSMPSNLSAGDNLTDWLAHKLASNEKPTSVVSLTPENVLPPDRDIEQKDINQAAAAARGLGSRSSSAVGNAPVATTAAAGKKHSTGSQSGENITSAATTAFQDQTRDSKASPSTAKLAVPGVYDLVATIMGIDVVPYIQPKNFLRKDDASSTSTSPLATSELFQQDSIAWARLSEESNLPLFTWSTLNKSGYLNVTNDGQSVDGRLGIGNVFGSQGFRTGIVEWVFICENSEGRLRCGIVNPVLSKFDVLSTWGFSRHKLYRAGYGWLSNMIRAEKGLKIHVILDLRGQDKKVTQRNTPVEEGDQSCPTVASAAAAAEEAEDASYLIVVIDDEPKFRLTGLPPGMTFFPMLFVEGCAVTGQYEEGRKVDPWWSLNGDIQAAQSSLRRSSGGAEGQEATGGLDVMDLSRSCSRDKSFRSKFREERRDRVLQTVSQEQAQQQNRAWKALDHAST